MDSFIAYTGILDNRRNQINVFMGNVESDFGCSPFIHTFASEKINKTSITIKNKKI